MSHGSDSNQNITTGFEIKVKTCAAVAIAQIHASLITCIQLIAVEFGSWAVSQELGQLPLWMHGTFWATAHTSCIKLTVQVDALATPTPASNEVPTIVREFSVN